MAIDFNNSKSYVFNYVTKDKLLQYISEYDILKNYYPSLELGSSIQSPFRKDTHPSFSLFFSEKNDCILYKDQTTGEIGDIFDFIKRLYNFKSFNDVLEQIVFDFNLTDKFSLTSSPQKILDKPKTYDINQHEISGFYNLQIKRRSYTKRDLLFWQSYCISKSTLKQYYVYPIEGYFANNIYIPTPDPAYAFLEYKDNKLTYKIYRPFARKERKWRTNHPYGVHQGYNQLPKKGNLLIITKSLKDVMCLKEVTGIPSIAIQAESNTIKTQVIAEYNKRFKYVITLFDNDLAGLEGMTKYFKKNNLYGVSIPVKDYPTAKDFSDLTKQIGPTQASYVLQTELNKII